MKQKAETIKNLTIEFLDPSIESGDTNKQAEMWLPETFEFMRNHFDLSEFDPEWELRQIRAFVKTLPPDAQSSQRKKLMQEFKTKLKLRREDMAEVQIEMEQLFRDNPDILEDEALSRVIKLLNKHSISWLSDKEHIRAVEKYLEIRSQVRTLITRYKTLHENRWEVELFKDLFDRYPNGKIEIETTLAGIYIRIHDIEDFVVAHTGGQESTSALKTARMSGGACLDRTFAQIPELSKRVTIENSSVWDEKNSRIVKTHEEEHAIHKNLYSERLFGFPSYLYSWTFETKTVNYADFVKEITTFLRRSMTVLQGSVKTEILAFLKDGRYDLAYIRHFLKEKGGLYDYLEPMETHVGKTVVRHQLLEQSGINVIRDGNLLDHEEVVRIAVDLLRNAYEKDYLKTLELAFNAMSDLMNRYGQDPQNKAKVINLLSQEPLEKWPRLVRILS